MMEGSENDSEIKVFQDLNYEDEKDNNIGQNTLSNISDCFKELGEASDSSLDCLAKELFREDSNSNNLSSNNNKKNSQFNYKTNNKSLALESGEERVILGDLPECSGLVNFIDKTLTLSNQNIIQALSESIDKNKEKNGKYSITFHDLLEGFKYDCHVITEQLSGIKSTAGKPQLGS